MKGKPSLQLLSWAALEWSERKVISGYSLDKNTSPKTFIQNASISQIRPGVIVVQEGRLYVHINFAVLFGAGPLNNCGESLICFDQRDQIGLKFMCIFPRGVSGKWPEGAKVNAYTVQFRVDIAIGFLVGTDTDCIHHQHTPLSTGDASPRQGHGQLAVRVVSTLEWCRNLSTAGFTQLKPERRSTKSGSSAWTPGLLNPTGMGRCSLRVRKAPSGAASSADRGPASPAGDPGRRKRMPVIGNCRIFFTMRWRDRGDGRSSTTLMCK